MHRSWNRVPTRHSHRICSETNDTNRYSPPSTDEQELNSFWVFCMRRAYLPICQNDWWRFAPMASIRTRREWSRTGFTRMENRKIVLHLLCSAWENIYSQTGYFAWTYFQLQPENLGLDSKCLAENGSIQWKISDAWNLRSSNEKKINEYRNWMALNDGADVKFGSENTFRNSWTYKNCFRCTGEHNNGTVNRFIRFVS